MVHIDSASVRLSIAWNVYVVMCGDSVERFQTKSLWVTRYKKYFNDWRDYPMRVNNLSTVLDRVEWLEKNRQFT